MAHQRLEAFRDDASEERAVKRAIQEMAPSSSSWQDIGSEGPASVKEYSFEMSVGHNDNVQKSFVTRYLPQCVQSQPRLLWQTDDTYKAVGQRGIAFRFSPDLDDRDDDLRVVRPGDLVKG